MNNLLCARAWLTLVCSVACVMTIQAQQPELVVQTGHAASVRHVAYSPDGRLLASAGERHVKLWDAATGQELRSFIAHTDSVSSIAFTKDSRTLVTSGGTDGTIKLWDVNSGRELRTRKAHSTLIYAMALSPDGKLVASLGVDALNLWNLGDDTSVRLTSGGVGFVAFSPDGKTLAAIIYGKLRLWDIATRQELSEPLPASSVIAFSPDGRLLATQDGDDSTEVAIWDVALGVKLRTLGGHRGKVYAVAFSPDGKRLATAAKEKIKLWQVATGQEAGALEAVTRDVYALCFAPDGKTLASGNLDRSIRLWDVASGAQRDALESSSGFVNSVAFSPNRRYLASLDARGLGLWDMTAGEQMRALGGSAHVTSFAFGPDSQTLIGGGGGALTIWDLASGTELRTLKGLPDSFKFVLSPDGRHLAVDTADETIAIWDLAAGRKTRTLLNHSSSSSVAFSGNSRVLACKGNDGTTNLWNLSTGRKLKAISSDEVSGAAVALNSDGSRMANAMWDGVALWDTRTGRRIRDFKEEVNYYTALAFSPDDVALAVGRDDGTVKLLDAATGAEMALSGELPAWLNFGGHFAIRSVEGVPLAALREGGRIRLLNSGTKAELASLMTFNERDWMVVAPDGLFDGSAAAWRRILWRFNRNTFEVAPVEIFFNEFYYPGLLSDIVTGRRPRAAADISQKDRRQPNVQVALAEDSSSAGRAQIAARSVRVKLTVTDAGAGAQDVRLFRNGSLVKVFRGDVLKGQKSAAMEVTLPIVAGENRLTAYAFNRDNIKSADASLLVTGAAGLKRAGTAYVIAVGVNEYANREFNLRYAVPDALLFGEEVSRRQTGLGRYASVEVINLLDHEASKANILLALKLLTGTASFESESGAPAALRRLKTAEPEDAVLVYFSGHGLAVSNSFYLIPTDLGYTGARDRKGLDAGLETILSHSISDRELEESFEKIDAGQLLLVIDACNSGQALEAEEKRRGPMNSKGLAQLAYEKGLSILTAAESQQVAVAPRKLGHGYLTYALVEEGLRGVLADRGPRDGSVYLREWLDYATGRVPQMQEEGERERRLLKQEEEPHNGRTKAPSTRRGEQQRPRVFYRREPEAQPLLVARTK